jgi:hypothetical protein
VANIQAFIQSGRKALIDIRRRFSPGYKDFSLGAQKGFVRCLQNQWPQFHLTAGGLLLPEKSITALKGVWPAASPAQPHQESATTP